MERVGPSAWLVATLYSGWCSSNGKKKYKPQNPTAILSSGKQGFSLLQRVSLSSQVGGNFQGTWNFPLQQGQSWGDSVREPVSEAHASPGSPSIGPPQPWPRWQSEMISSGNGGQPKAWSLPIVEKPVCKPGTCSLISWGGWHRGSGPWRGIGAKRVVLLLGLVRERCSRQETLQILAWQLPVPGCWPCRDALTQSWAALMPV